MVGVAEYLDHTHRHCTSVPKSYIGTMYYISVGYINLAPYTCIIPYNYSDPYIIESVDSTSRDGPDMPYM